MTADPDPLDLERAEQELPPKVLDPAVLRRVAQLVAGVPISTSSAGAAPDRAPETQEVPA